VKKPFGREGVEGELSFHFDSLVEDLIAGGLTLEEAHLKAAQRLGNLDEVKSQCAAIEARRERTERWGHWLGDLRQDLALALRQLARRPVFTAGVAITLALGLGANCAIFAALDALILRPLRGVSSPGELLINVGEITTKASHGKAWPKGFAQRVSLPALREFGDQSRTMQIAGYTRQTFAIGDNEIASGLIVSGSYFETLRPRVESGRLLTRDDDLPGAPLAVVASHAFAQRHPGQELRINGMPAEIVGVVSREFHGTRVGLVPEVWVPFSAFARLKPSSWQSLDMEDRGWSWIEMFGRLRRGSSLAEAQAELSGIAASNNATYPDQLLYSVSLAPLETSTAQVKIFAAVLAGVVLFVLLLACANVANLLLSRAAARRREIAVRTALGATRSRVVRQLLTEALLLALIGGSLGLLLAHLATQALPLLPLPAGLSLPEVRLAGNGRVFAFATILSLLTTFLFGLPPALHATRIRLTHVLQEEGGRGQSRLRDLLLVVQVSLSVVLLVGAGLFLRALQSGLQIDPGFRPERLAYASVSEGLVHHTAAQAEVEYREISTAASQLPGVSAAAWTTTLPLSDHRDIAMALPEGRTPGEEEWVETLDVGDGYLATMGLQLQSGRWLQPHEPTPVMVISQSAERKLFPGPGGALGKRVVFTIGKPPVEVVGVVADARYHTLEGEPRPLAYLPLDREPVRLDSMTLLVRTAGDPRPLSKSLREAIARAAPGVPVVAAGALEEKLADLLAPQRLGMIFLGIFAALGLLLAFVGTASVTAFALAQRTRELGIRLALGASGPKLLSQVLKQTLGRLVLGVCAGAGIAWLSTRGLNGFLYGVPPADPLSFAAAGLLMTASGLLAALIPARRILQIDPSISLRAE
jgi:putative ABC transport system permease protein